MLSVGYKNYESFSGATKVMKVTIEPPCDRTSMVVVPKDGIKDTYEYYVDDSELRISYGFDVTPLTCAERVSLEVDLSTDAPIISNVAEKVLTV